MKTFLSVTLSGLVLCSCMSFPQILPLQKEQARPEIVKKCLEVFPSKKFRAVHSIDASMPMGNSSSMMGASQVDPVTRTIRAVLVSVEGLTLFDATSVDGVVDVHRALAPFDSGDFGTGLMDDVSVVLMAPQGELQAVGVDSDGRLVCRYRGNNGGVIDLLPGDESVKTSVRIYDKDASLVRVAEFFDTTGPMGLAKKVILSAPGLVGYELILSLVGAEPIIPPDKVIPPAPDD